MNKVKYGPVHMQLLGNFEVGIKMLHYRLEHKKVGTLLIHSAPKG